MKIIVLDSTAKSIKAVLASSVATSNPDFVVAYADTSDNTFSELSSDGQLNGTTDVTLVSAPASGVKRAIKSITIYNRDTAAVTVSIKFDNGGTQRILQRVQLVSGETWHSDELTKLSPGGSDTQVQFNDLGTLAGSSNFTYNKTTSVLTLGANPVLSGGTANGVLYLNGSKSATTGSVLTFDGAQLAVNGITLGRGAGAVATNTAVGASALAANTTGALNVAVGYEALLSNTTAGWNTAVGNGALRTNTGARNTAVGRRALYSNTTGGDNAAFGAEDSGGGYAPLWSNTTGSYNTAVGNAALGLNTTASYNTAVGYQAGYSNTTGTLNTFIGNQAGYSVTTGNQNCFVGQSQSGYYVTTGSNNTILGNYSGNQGGLDIRTASNYIVLSDGVGNPRIYNDGNVTYFKSADNAVSSRIGTKYVSSVGTGATTIATTLSDYGQIVIVNGNSSGNIFTDLIFTCSTAGPTVLSAKTISGGPAGRTYTMNSGYLQLAMASGTYSVWCNQYLGT